MRKQIGWHESARPRVLGRSSTTRLVLGVDIELDLRAGNVGERRESASRPRSTRVRDLGQWAGAHLLARKCLYRSREVNGLPSPKERRRTLTLISMVGEEVGVEVGDGS